MPEVRCPQHEHMHCTTLGMMKFEPDKLSFNAIGRKVVLIWQGLTLCSHVKTFDIQQCFKWKPLYSYWVKVIGCFLLFCSKLSLLETPVYYLVASSNLILSFVQFFSTAEVTPPTLPVAPPPEPRQLTVEEQDRLLAEEEKHLRELRIFLRDCTNKLLAEKKFKAFSKPVDLEEVRLSSFTSVVLDRVSSAAAWLLFSCSNSEFSGVCIVQVVTWQHTCSYGWNTPYSVVFVMCWISMCDDGIEGLSGFPVVINLSALPRCVHRLQK